MAIQSEHAFVFTNRVEFDEHLGAPMRLDNLRLLIVPMKRKLIPIADLLRRKYECELPIVKSSFQACAVQSRSAGPVKIGSAEFSSAKGDGTPRVGSKISMPRRSRFGVSWLLLMQTAGWRWGVV